MHRPGKNFIPGSDWNASYNFQSFSYTAATLGIRTNSPLFFVPKQPLRNAPPRHCSLLFARKETSTTFVRTSALTNLQGDRGTFFSPSRPTNSWHALFGVLLSLTKKE